MSAGLTPPMRLACPMSVGRTCKWQDSDRDSKAACAYVYWCMLMAVRGDTAQPRIWGRAFNTQFL